MHIDESYVTIKSKVKGVDVKVDLGNMTVGGQLSNVVVEVAKISVIANHVDEHYASWNRAGH